MTDGSPEPSPVTRLGPDSGGRNPGAPPDVRVYSWEWGPNQARRPGLPWIGLFLLVFGGLLLLQELIPGTEAIGSVFTLAIGLAFLLKWAIDRGTGSLYAGALITALAAPGIINALGYEADGIGTFCFGLAFLGIALVRVVGGGGLGWQGIFGGLLVMLGAINMFSPNTGDLIIPIVLVGLGALFVIGGMTRR
jgi:hypothetical protein